jgi:RNA polymerase sigma factor (sigma-70 family)
LEKCFAKTKARNAASPKHLAASKALAGETRTIIKVVHSTQVRTSPAAKKAVQHRLQLQLEPLVGMLSRHFARHAKGDVDLEDFKQHAWLAIAEGMSDWDSTKGSLQTYMSHRIHSALFRLAMDFRGPTRVATNCKDKQAYFRLKTAILDTQRRHPEASPSLVIAEAAKIIGVEVAVAERMLPRLERTDVSLDTGALGLVAHESGAASDPEQDLSGKDEQERLLPLIRRAIGRLSQRHRSVIELRYFSGEKQQTFEQTGQAMGYSKKHTRSLELEAMALLRSHLEQEGVTAADIGQVLPAQPAPMPVKSAGRDAFFP